MTSGAPTSTGRRSVPWTLVLAAAGGTAAATALADQGLVTDDRERWTTLVLLCWAVVLLLLGLVALRPAAGRRATVLVLLLGAACCQVPGLLHPPQGSTDAYRYVWDGRVQLSGTSPYRYAPGDDALADLRDPILFPGLGPDDPSGITTVLPLPTDRAALHPFTRNDDRIAINRPQVTTVYPPVAEAWFAAVAAVTPWSAGTLGLQLAAALVAVAVTGGLARLLIRIDRDPRWAALWGFSPLVAYEAAGNGHVDVLAAGFVVLAVGVLGLDPGRRGRVVGGVVLGLAVATKLTPLLLLPALTALRHGRREALVAVTTLGTTLASYVPHVLAVGGLVLGFLPAYLVDEGYDGGGRFALLGLLGLPGPARAPVALVVALAAAGLALWKADPRQPWTTACALYGTALLVSSPSYPWYALPLLALAVLARRPEWVAVALAATVRYALAPSVAQMGRLWLTATVLVVAVTLGRVVVRRWVGRDEVTGVRSGHA